MMKNLNRIVAIIVMALVAITMWLGYRTFSPLWEDDLIIPSEYVTEVKWLSDYHPPLKGKRGDTRIFFIDSGKPGATVSINGGVHPDEQSGVMTSMIMIERVKPETGKLIIIPQMNNSAFTHSYPQEATPQYYHLTTKDGKTRRFRGGARGANPLDFWPDPEVFSHYQTGQKLSGEEVRNLNRNFPGRANGNFTEQVAYAIFKVLIDEKVDLNIDLHEAWPEYTFVNALGADKKSADMATLAALELRMNGMDIGVEVAPDKFRGLTYRELGEYSNAWAVLAETANPSMGRIRGITNETLIIDGQDAFYVRAAQLGRTFVPFDEKGWPLQARVARHLATVDMITTVYAELNPDKPFSLSHMPSYEEAWETPVGHYLNSPTN